MRAIVTTAPGRMELREVQEPEPMPGEAVVGVRAVGLCGSDVHLYQGDHPYSRFPNVQGHEFCGVIEAFGPGYAGSLQVGDLVAVEPLIACGRCFACRRGHPNCCVELVVMGVQSDGALAERLAVPVACCHRADGLSTELAALVEPMSIGLQAVTRGRVSAGDGVLVLGAGPIGHAATLAAADRGAEVMTVDRLDNRLVLAAALGAARTLNTEQASLEEAVAEWTGGEGPAVIIDATGAPELIRQAVDVVAPSGTVVIVGISMREVSLSVTEFTKKELNVLGSRNNAGVFGQALDLVARHTDRVARLVTHRFPCLEAPSAIEFAMRHQAEVEKVLLVWEPA